MSEGPVLKRIRPGSRRRLRNKIQPCIKVREVCVRHHRLCVFQLKRLSTGLATADPPMDAKLPCSFFGFRRVSLVSIRVTEIFTSSWVATGVVCSAKSDLLYTVTYLAAA